MAASQCCLNNISQAEVEAILLSSRAQHSRHTSHALTCRCPTPAITHSLQLSTCLAVDGHSDSAQAGRVTVAWGKAPTAVPVSLNGLLTN